MPHGTANGTAFQTTKEQAATLLDVLRKKNERIPENKIGCCGRDAFGGIYKGYAIEHRIQLLDSGAEVPVTVEAWARCSGWKSGVSAVTAQVETYLNRSAVPRGLYASGEKEAIYLHGAEVDAVDECRVEARPGRYDLAISIITPHIPLLSEGKAPSFEHLSQVIADVVSKAMKSARRGVPADDATEEEIAEAEAEAQADRQAKEADAKRREERRRKRAAEEAEWAAIKGDGVLARTI